MQASNPLTVLMLTSSYPRDREDSAGIFLRHMAEGLARRGVAVHVLAPAAEQAGSSVEGGVVVHRFRYLPSPLRNLAYGSGILSNLKRLPWLWAEVPFFILMMTVSLFRLLRKERPHLVHAHWLIPQGLIAVLAKLFYKVPVVSTAHGSDVFALRGRAFDRLRQYVLRQSDAWTANSLATAEAVGERTLLPTPNILPMGVDIRPFQGGRATNLRATLPENEFLLLFVGRLVEQKGVEHLLQAMALLPEGLRARTNLWVVGDGQDRGRLEQQAQALAIDGKVRFWGHVSNDRLPDFYATADLFVAPSGGAEGQGLVLSEASASRLCVLATRAGATQEIVRDGITGVLVQPHQPQELADAIATLLSDKPLRDKLAENALARVKQLYDVENTAREFETLYRTILARRQAV